MVAPDPREKARDALKRFAGGGLTVTEQFARARELLDGNPKAIEALDNSFQNAAECHAHNIQFHGRDRV